MSKRKRGLYLDVRVKVLQLDSWMKRMGQFNAPSLEEVSPVRFNRDGFYLHYDMCWFEVGGKAYLYDKSLFLYKLKLLEGRILSNKEEEALRYLSSMGVTDGRLLLSMSKQLKGDRNIHRRFLGIKKGLREKRL